MILINPLLCVALLSLDANPADTVSHTTLPTSYKMIPLLSSCVTAATMTASITGNLRNVLNARTPCPTAKVVRTLLIAIGALMVLSLTQTVDSANPVQLRDVNTAISIKEVKYATIVTTVSVSIRLQRPVFLVLTSSLDVDIVDYITTIHQ